MFNILPRQVTSTFSWCNDHKVLPIMQKCMNEPLTKRKPLIFVQTPLYSSAGNSPELIHISVRGLRNVRKIVLRVRRYGELT